MTSPIRLSSDVVWSDAVVLQFLYLIRSSAEKKLTHRKVLNFRKVTKNVKKKKLVSVFLFHLKL